MAPQSPKQPCSLTVFGITGRMGQALIRALRESSEFHLGAAVASAGSTRLGQDAVAEGAPSGVPITADVAQALKGASVALEFSVGGAVGLHAQACAKAAVPLLIGATGYDAASKVQIERASESIAVLIAPNTSVAVAVLNELAATAARALGGAYDVDISEAHHRQKRDAPSGTALNLGETVAKSRGVSFSEVAALEGLKPGSTRRPGTIGFSVVRAGDIVGEHTVTFSGAGERLELTHRATDRIAFARGALRAAAWLVGRPPGLYGMKDVLGL